MLQLEIAETRVFRTCARATYLDIRARWVTTGTLSSIFFNILGIDLGKCKVLLKV